MKSTFEIIESYFPFIKIILKDFASKRWQNIFEIFNNQFFLYRIKCCYSSQKYQLDLLA